MFKDDVHKFISKEIYGRVAALQAQITKDKDSSKSRNSLGVLYARYDLMTEAEAEFQKVIKQKEYLPALLNEGNLLYQKGSYDDALTFYQRAYKLDQKNSRTLLAIARAEHELEDYGQTKKMYDALKKADPDLAQQFAYLDLKGEESTRAAEIGNVKEVVLWED
jgi:tetratricopeptide (TPR) repeat protein